MRYHHILLVPSVLGSHLLLQNTTSQGSCSSAVDIMAYHREKMHQYLCRKYLAEEITGEEHVTAEKRSYIDDAGSKNYKNWLQSNRSTTLEDLYRHYEQSTAEDAPIGASLPPGNFDGQVTGYAMLGNKASGAGAETTGYGVGTTYAAPQHDYDAPSIKSGSDIKGMKLHDLFQLALTAIAFLAFGVFLIQVIMCVMDIKTTKEQMSIVMVRRPATLQDPENYFKTDDPAETVTVTETAARSSRASSLDQIFLNQLAAKAAASLDGLEILHKDGGKYLEKSLCEANNYSRSLSGKRKIWLPLWSFGMSWIAGRRLTQFNEPSLSPIGIMKFLTASIQGMAGVDCLKI